MHRIFVVGCPRSGTTLAQALLASHPDLVTFPETHFFSTLFSQSRLLRWLGLASRSTDAILMEIATHLGVSRPDRRGPVWTVGAATDAFVNMLDKHARNEGAQGWVEKTPAHLHWIEQIEDLVSGAQFCHVLRRGPDVVASLYDVTRRNPDTWGGARSLDRCMKRWLDDVSISLNHLDRSRHSHVRYDSLTRNPEDIVPALWETLGLSHTSFSSEAFRRTGRDVEPEDAPWQNVGDAVDRSRGGRISDRLTVSQCEQVRRQLRNEAMRRELYFRGRPLFD